MINDSQISPPEPRWPAPVHAPNPDPGQGTNHSVSPTETSAEHLDEIYNDAWNSWFSHRVLGQETVDLAGVKYSGGEAVGGERTK